VKPAPRLLRISTEMLPERDRFAAFREEFASKVLAMDLVDLSGGHPRIDLTVLPLGPVAVGSLIATPTEFIRDRHHLQDRNNDFRLDIVESGPIHYLHADREHVYDSGWAHFCDQGRPQRGTRAAGGATRSVVMQAAALEGLVKHPEDLAGRPLRPGPALHLLDGYLRSLTSFNEPPSADLGPIIGTHVLDLAAAALSPIVDAKEVVATRGVKAARLHAILAKITHRFKDPTLNIDNTAATLGLSRRYMQELLEQTGKSFTEHLAERRLECAYAMLSDGRYRQSKIIDIAYEAGFSDASHFYRMFRRRYGESPSDVRAAATGKAQG